jgi:hypothetical protein
MSIDLTPTDLPERVVPAEEVREAQENANKYHPVYGLQRRLLIEGKLYTYDAYLDHWISLLGHEMSGTAILNGMSTTLRVEVAQ